MRRKLRTLLLILPLLASGCMTHKLWTESALDEWNRPADNSDLRLFRDERRDDLLAVYDEYSERHETTQTRAFFLNQNQKLLAKNVRPHFVNVKSAGGLTPVPMFSFAPTNSLEKFYAITATNGTSFDIFSGGRKISSNQLPTYNDGTGQWERIAWTPVAVTMDLTIIGGAIGYWWIAVGGPGLGGSR